jgi:hypothetical protein
LGIPIDANTRRQDSRGNSPDDDKSGRKNMG